MSTESVLQNSTRAVGGVPQKPPVLGGSGRQYWTIRDALAGEAALAVTVAGVVPQAGTGAGVVVFQAAQSAVNNFYKDQYILNTDTTPTNGLVAQWMRISDYVGATRTATGDKPWDFSGESTVSVIQPARISLQGDVSEDVTITIPLELNLQGHKILGKVDVTGGGFLWIRGGSGYITNGIQKTDFGFLKIDDCVVSRRNTTVYAVLMTEGSNLGSVELSNCTFMGRVSGRRGFISWNIDNCINNGLSESGINVPYTLVESIAGVAVVVSQFVAEIDSQLGGAFFYSENSITGATAYMSMTGIIRIPMEYNLLSASPEKWSFVKAVNAATLTLTATTGDCHLSVVGPTQSSAVSLSDIPILSFVNTLNFTGTCSWAPPAGLTFTMNCSGLLQIVLVEGTSDTTGSITAGGGNAKRIFASGADIHLFDNGGSAFKGALVISGGGIQIQSCRQFGWTDLGADITAGAPTFTVSAAVTIDDCQAFVGSFDTNTHNISVGTWTWSGNLALKNAGVGASIWALGSLVSGGTWTVSGNFSAQGSFNSSNTPSLTAVRILAHSGTGGTITVSGTVDFQGGRQPMDLVLVDGAGATASMTSATVNVYYVVVSGSRTIVTASTSTSTASLTGTVVYGHCQFEGSVSFLASNPAGASVTGPVALSFYHCAFMSTLRPQSSGGGTFAWGAGAALKFFHCHIEGLYTVVYTPFTTHQAFHTRFNGNSSNKSIAGSGTRPTTLEYWGCTAAARYDDILPNWLAVYDVLPAQAALVQGQPVKVNAANQYQVCVAASIVDGVSYDAPAGAGSRTVAIRDGRCFVAAKAGTANGDNLALDLVTPTQTNLAAFTPGQNVGTALEAVGTTVAGKSYAAVNVR